MVRRMLADLIALAFGPRTDAVEVLRDTRSARLRAIQDDIAKHIDSCGLSVRGVAARQRVTPRYVQMLFASEGTTFVQFVLALRLAEVRRRAIARKAAKARWARADRPCEAGFNSEFSPQ